MDVFPTAYFGNVMYFKNLVQSKNPFIETSEHFIKQTVRSRCTISSANGIQQLSIPTTRPNGSKSIISTVGISYDTHWEKDHWKAIESGYASSPYFEFYDKEIKELIFSKPTSLIEFNTTITNQILKWLDLKVQLNFTKEYQLDIQGIDYRAFQFDKRLPLEHYIQVFQSDKVFIPNLSILDLLFCEGPMARKWILNP